MSAGASLSQLDTDFKLQRMLPDNGGPWQPARLIGERRRHSWQWWELLTRCETRGTKRVRAGATDLAGRVQPEQPEWNRLGYGANAIQEVAITVE